MDVNTRNNPNVTHHFLSSPLFSSLLPSLSCTSTYTDQIYARVSRSVLTLVRTTQATHLCTLPHTSGAVPW